MNINLIKCFFILLLAISFTVSGQPPKKAILINNVQIFDGVNEKTVGGNVLVEDNLIKKISNSAITPDAGYETTVIDGGGKFLMPGLIDVHSHLMFSAINQQTAMLADIGLVTLIAAKDAEALLLQGFTSVRDMGGPVFGLKAGIDMGVTKGPRIWPSGAFITQTGGHGDFRMPTDVPTDASRGKTYAERINAIAIADGADAVLRSSREQLMLGATQLKLMAGGGVSSFYDPIDVSQYTSSEFRAAVEAAENWGTYVTVHAYTPRAIQTAIEAGVKCIDHGQLIDEATVKMMAEKGIWWSLQPFLDDEDANPKSSEAGRQKQLEVSRGTENAYTLAKKYKVKTAWGSDVLFSPGDVTKEGKMLAKLIKWYTPYEILKMATSTNAELLAMAGLRSPYQKPLGVIKEGAYADLILVDGNPIKDINLVADPHNKFLLIVKDGVIYKNTL